MSTTQINQNSIQQTTDQINQLISQSSDAILCGPDCQKIRKTGLLRQTYLDAQANEETAPIQLQEAEKNYYTYTQGTTGYNTIRKNELTKQVSTIVASSTAKFESEIDNAKELTKTYNSLHITYKNMKELYQRYLEENKQLQKQVRHLTADTVTNDRKSFYESQGYDALQNWYILWKWIYIILVVVYVIGLFLVKSGYSIAVRIVILVALIVYPFIIQFLFRILYGLFEKLYSYLPKNIYLT